MTIAGVEQRHGEKLYLQQKVIPAVYSERAAVSRETERLERPLAKKCGEVQHTLGLRIFILEHQLLTKDYNPFPLSLLLRSRIIAKDVAAAQDKTKISKRLYSPSNSMNAVQECYCDCKKS